MKLSELISPAQQPSTITNYLLPRIVNFILGGNIYLSLSIFLTSVDRESVQLVADMPEVQMRNQAVLDQKSESASPGKGRQPTC